MNSPNFQTNKILSHYTTLGIGGPARYFLEIKTIEEMQLAIRYCLKEKIPYMILGKGSNCLFDSRGFDGAILLNKIDFLIKPSPETFHVGAGYSFSLLGAQTARQCYTGLEFASGIPGSIGGAVYMNAGANGSDVSQCLLSVDYVNENGERITWSKESLSFSYRSSSFQQMKGAIVGATFSLNYEPTARQKQLDIINYRKKTQPLSEKSAGCIFRNPNCGHAGALIEKCQMKGMNTGGAKVSEIHANFIVNADSASSQDVLQLIETIKNQVKAQTGIELESEVKCIPYQLEKA